MKRDLGTLVGRRFDLLVIGGGIYGACAAWDAAQRGLSVAMVERRDFGGGTSANSFKMVHGGIRYLQHADLARIRESSRERSALLRIAPHLVEPLPIAIPTYGHGSDGREILAAGSFLYDLLVCDRNRHIPDPDRCIPGTRLLSRTACESHFPDLPRANLTGAVVFHDAQMYNPPRLTLSFVRSAHRAGATIANYVEAVGFIRNGEDVVGIEARDTRTGESFDVRARVVLNAAGPWAEDLLRRGAGEKLSPPCTYSRDAYFVLKRPWPHRHALAVQAMTSDPDAIVSRHGRHLFLVPWRDYTLVGVWHTVYEGNPDGFVLGRSDLDGFIREVNQAYPPLALTLDDVSFQNAGLVLFGENRPDAVNLRYGKRSRIVDHARTIGIGGLVTMIGVRATTARGVAEQAVDLVFRKLDHRPPPCRTAREAIHGGRISAVRDFVQAAIAGRPEGVDADVMASLVRNHGSEFRGVTRYMAEDASLTRTLAGSHVARAEVVHAIRDEMAQTLGDIVFRRTDLGTGAHPGDPALEECARLAAGELGWSEARRVREMEEVRDVFPGYGRETARMRTG